MIPKRLPAALALCIAVLGLTAPPISPARGGRSSASASTADAPKTIHVWKESPGPTVPYPSKLQAAIQVKDALAIAEPGDTVLVYGDCKDGQCRYQENLLVPCGVALLGNGTPDATPILDGGKAGSVIEGKGVFKGCPQDQVTRVAYFCITNGKATTGAGIRFFNRRALIDHNCIHDNEANIGAGIHILLQHDGVPKPVVEIQDNLIGVSKDGRFGPNVATSQGGGIAIEATYKNPSRMSGWVVNVERNTIRQNRVRGGKGYIWGGGISILNARVLARSNLFEKNVVMAGGATGETYGGAVAVLNMDENTIESLGQLAATGLGLAKFLQSPYELDVGQYHSEGNIYRENGGFPSSPVGGGIVRGGAIAAVFNVSVSLKGDWVVGNQAGLFGGALYSSGLSLVQVKNSHVTENVSTNDGGGLYISCGSALDLLGGNKIDRNVSEKPKFKSPLMGGGGGLYIRNSQARIMGGSAPNQISENQAKKGGHGAGILFWEVDKLRLLRPGSAAPKLDVSDLLNRALSQGEADICNKPAKLLMKGPNSISSNVAEGTESTGGGLEIVLEDDREERKLVRPDVLGGSQFVGNKADVAAGIHYLEQADKRSSNSTARFQGLLIEDNDLGGMVVQNAGKAAMLIRSSTIKENTRAGLHIIDSNPAVADNQFLANDAIQIQVNVTGQKNILPFIAKNHIDGMQKSLHGIRVRGGVSSGTPAEKWINNNVIDHKEYAAFSSPLIIDMTKNWWGPNGPVVTPAGGPVLPNSVNPKIVTAIPLTAPEAIPVGSFAPILVSPSHPTPPVEPVCDYKVEVDYFPESVATATIEGPGIRSTVVLQGPTTVHVRLGDLADTDGDGLEQVRTQMVQLDLKGTGPLGPLTVRLNSDKPTLGEIEETTNATPGVLDVPPFTSTGTATSSFDVFFEVETGDLLLHNEVPSHMEEEIEHKPPGPGEDYENRTRIELFDRNNQPSGFRLVEEIHTPNPDIEVDVFPNSEAVATVEFMGQRERVNLKGPTTVHVNLSALADTDGDGLEQVRTEIVEMQLEGNSPLFGPVEVRVRPEDKHPFLPTAGEIEETANTQSGRLDLPPFASSGSAASFFDVFFEIEVQGMLLHNDEPKHMEATITFKPPAPGNTYENPDVIPLFDENHSQTRVNLGSASHTPNPQRPPPDGGPH